MPMPMKTFLPALAAVRPAGSSANSSVAPGVE
jgi:hypothetical protein